MTEVVVVGGGHDADPVSMRVRVSRARVGRIASASGHREETGGGDEIVLGVDVPVDLWSCWVPVEVVRS